MNERRRDNVDIASSWVVGVPVIHKLKERKKKKKKRKWNTSLTSTGLRPESAGFLPTGRHLSRQERTQTDHCVTVQVAGYHLDGISVVSDQQLAVLGIRTRQTETHQPRPGLREGQVLDQRAFRHLFSSQWTIGIRSTWER